MCWLPPVSRTTKKKPLTRILSRSFSQMSATSLQHQDVLKPSTSLTSEVSTRWAVGTAWRMASLVIFCRQLFCRQSGCSNVPTKWGEDLSECSKGWRACSQGACFLWYCWWTKSCTTKDDDYPIIYGVLAIPGGAGFRLPTVCFNPTCFTSPL